MIFDSHAHLNFADFANDWKEIADDCQKNNVWIVNVGAQFETSKKGIAIAENYPKGIYASVALHPIHVEGSKFNPENFDQVEYAKLIETSKKVVAIGETGIDLFHDDSNLTKQHEVFKQHIELAKKYDLPLIIHGRNGKEGQNAYAEIIKTLKETKIDRGVVHCFGGNLKEAQEFVELGFFVGFTGIITFDKTGQLAEVVKGLQLENILIETDSPYLAPEPYRGKRNLPQYVSYVAKKIGEIKEIKNTEVEEVTYNNAKKLFAIK